MTLLELKEVTMALPWVPLDTFYTLLSTILNQQDSLQRPADDLCVVSELYWDCVSRTTSPAVQYEFAEALFKQPIVLGAAEQMQIKAYLEPILEHLTHLPSVLRQRMWNSVKYMLLYKTCVNIVVVRQIT